jgi:hypothetical protein
MMRQISQFHGTGLRRRGRRGGRQDASGGRTVRVQFAAVLLAIFPAISARACPLCKDSAPVSDARGDDTVTDTAGLNFNGSIYGLLGGVTLAGGVVTAAMIKAARAGGPG